MAKHESTPVTAAPCSNMPLDICLLKFEQILDKLEIVKENQQEAKALHQAVEKRLFYDNGQTCLQTKVNNNTKTARLLMWVFGLYCTFNIAVMGWLLITQLRG
jgi:hypothetical protein